MIQMASHFVPILDAGIIAMNEAAACNCNRKAKKHRISLSVFNGNIFCFNFYATACEYTHTHTHTKKKNCPSNNCCIFPVYMYELLPVIECNLGLKLLLELVSVFFAEHYFAHFNQCFGIYQNNYYITQC